MEDFKKKLEELREKIDRADRELVDILNRRASFALEISDVKKELGMPVYDPQREDRVLAAIVERNQGVIPDETLKDIFRVIIKETRLLEEKSGNEN